MGCQYLGIECMYASVQCTVNSGKIKKNNQDGHYCSINRGVGCRWVETNNAYNPQHTTRASLSLLRKPSSRPQELVTAQIQIPAICIVKPVPLHGDKYGNMARAIALPLRERGNTPAWVSPPCLGISWRGRSDLVSSFETKTLRCGWIFTRYRGGTGSWER